MFERKELKYDLSALEPFIDEKTMNEHYNVHYKKYTDNLNEAVEKEGIPEVEITTILKDYELFPIKIRENGGGFYNHTLYFENISPYNREYETSASEELKDKIKENFQSYYQFKKEFKKAGTEVFGSGWVWLIEYNNRLYIAKTKNQDNPVMTYNCKVLLGMDVWEHAYYLKHMADRSSYLDDFFEVIDWKVVSERL
jgi:Fe-Mn family superoxide dismutase